MSAFGSGKGLQVVCIYRDVEKYRAGSKLVEPSGSRSDRPALQSMLKDAASDEFDVILAWREDRLYRGLRSMLTVLETVQDYKIEILLAKENFDSKIAPVRAWVTQMELDGMKEWLAMGVIARLKAGKANTGQDRYGYIRIGEAAHLVEEEAKWVPEIRFWYLVTTAGTHLQAFVHLQNASWAGIHRGNKLDSEFFRSKNSFSFPASMMIPNPGRFSALSFPLRIHALICFEVTWQTCAA